MLDNLLSPSVEYINNNMSDRELSERYVGIHTFSEALERGIAGYREVLQQQQGEGGRGGRDPLRGALPGGPWRRRLLRG